jgi:hypothetical protein
VVLRSPSAIQRFRLVAAAAALALALVAGLLIGRYAWADGGSSSADANAFGAVGTERARSATFRFAPPGSPQSLQVVPGAPSTTPVTWEKGRGGPTTRYEWGYTLYNGDGSVDQAWTRSGFSTTQTRAAVSALPCGREVEVHVVAIGVGGTSAPAKVQFTPRRSVGGLSICVA